MLMFKNALSFSGLCWVIMQLIKKYFLKILFGKYRSVFTFTQYTQLICLKFIRFTYFFPEQTLITNQSPNQYTVDKKWKCSKILMTIHAPIISKSRINMFWICFLAPRLPPLFPFWKINISKKPLILACHNFSKKSKHLFV